MPSPDFLQQLDSRIAQYDLLCHPFYQAWSAGHLTREDLREYALEYYPHVNAFPQNLATLAARLPEGETRRAVLSNLEDENGADAANGRPHAEIWLDFAEGMGAGRTPAEPVTGVRELLAHFAGVAENAATEEALAAFYAYESQVPRVATEKERGLREMYGADDRTVGYFSLHQTADIFHKNVWQQRLARVVGNDSAAEARALNAAEAAAQALWNALDGIEQRRQARQQAA